MHATSNGKQLSYRDILIGIFALMFFIIASNLNRKITRPHLETLKQDTAITINRNLIRFFNLGNKRLIADLIWIQTLLEGDEEHYSKLDLNSWMYHRFMTIADLDPFFYENYLHGGMYLSIIKDDPMGATELLSRGIIQYPDDYRLNYNLGYNFVFELMDLKSGLQYFEKILNHPKLPVYYPSLINKLRYEVTGNYEIALVFLRDQLELTKDPSIKNKIKKEIYALKADMDLSCLNNGIKNCSIYDEDGNPYLKDKNNSWTSQQNFKKYQLNLKRRSQK